MKLSCSEKFVGILRGITSNHHKDRTEKNSKSMKCKYAMIMIIVIQKYLMKATKY